MPSSTGTLVFNDQKIQAPDIYATESLGVGVSDPTSNLEVVGNAYVSSNLEVGTANLFVDTTTGRVGVGTGSPAGLLDIRASSTDPGAVPTVHIGDAAADAGDYGMVNLVRHATTGGSKCHLSFIRSGNIVAGMGYHNNTNTLGIWNSFSSVTNTPSISIQSNHNVGIGVTNPGAKLDISATSGYIPGIRIGTNTTYSDDQLYSLAFGGSNLMGMGLYSSTRTVFGSQGLGIHIPNSEEFSIRTNNWAKLFALDGTEHTAYLGGELYIGRNGKDGGAMENITGSGRKNLFIQSTYNGNTSQNYGWWIGAQNQGLSSTDNDLYFAVVRNGTLTVPAFIQDNLSSEVQMNFTGQHRTFVKDTPTHQLQDKEGLIVSADQDVYIKMSGGVVRGNEAITTNESLPVVSFSNKPMDKACFGVLSTTEDPETRKEVHGNFVSKMNKELGDTRVYVNSVGEGAVWVTNINGPLESGDYITTSNIAGYGVKQDDDILHNYTVAKITMNCDFNPQTIPKKIIKKALSDVDYWIDYAKDKISQEEYETLPENERDREDDTYYKIYKREIQKINPENDRYVHEIHEEMVNVLDEHGQLQWEDHPTETEKAYKIRYLTADGTQTDEANAVHVAAFVGCTYHCG